MIRLLFIKSYNNSFLYKFKKKKNLKKNKNLKKKEKNDL